MGSITPNPRWRTDAHVLAVVLAALLLLALYTVPPRDEFGIPYGILAACVRACLVIITTIGVWRSLRKSGRGALHQFLLFVSAALLSLFVLLCAEAVLFAIRIAFH